MTSTAAMNGLLPAAPQPRWPPRRLPGPVGVIDLHETLQGHALVAFADRLHELVFQPPGGLLGAAELARQFEGGNAVLRLREEMDHEEPGGEREPGSGEQHSGGEPAAEAGASGAAAQPGRRWRR